MRRIHLVSDKTAQSASVGWIESTKHHMSQIGKGVLVAGLTLGGFGIWKRWWGQREIVTDAQPHGVSTIPNSQHTVASVGAATTIEPRHSTLQQTITLPSSMHISPDNTLTHVPKPSTVNKPSFLDNELDILFHEKEEISSSKASKANLHTTSKLEALLAQSSSGAQPRMKKKVMDKLSLNTPAAGETIVSAGEQFTINIPAYTTGSDGKTYFFGSMTAKQSSGSPLPAWLRLMPPASSFTAPVIGNVGVSDYANSVAVQNNLAIVPEHGGDILIINATNPLLPQVISSVPLPPSSLGLATVIQGHLAFVGCDFNIGTGALLIVNITNPKVPQTISQLATSVGIESMVVKGGLAYLAAGGLQIVNVSNPLMPNIISSVPGTSYSSSNGIAIQGNLALIVESLVSPSSGVFKIFNIANPTAPMLLSSLTSANPSFAVATQGNLALIAGSNYLQIVDITIPTAPNIIGNITTAGSDIVLQGELAFVAASYTGLQVINMTNPSVPETITNIVIPASADHVIIQGELAFVASLNGNSLQIVDLSAWAWKLVGTPSVSDLGIWDFQIMSNYGWGLNQYQQSLAVSVISAPTLTHPIPNLLVKPGQSLFYRFDTNFVDLEDGGLPFQNMDFSLVGTGALPSWLSVSFKPTLIGSVSNLGLAYDVVSEGNLVFLDAGSSLQIVNISNPEVPNLVYNLNLGSATSDVAVQGNLAFVAASSQLDIIDITNPVAPGIINAMQVISQAVSVQGNIVLVASPTSTLELIDISTPSQPNTISTYNLPNPPWDVAVQNDLVLVADQTNGLQIINIMDPKNPTFLGSLSTSDTILGVAIQGELAFLANGIGGLQIVNITNPKTPRVISTTIMPDVASSVSVLNDLAFVADSGSGLQIVNIKNLKSPKIVGSVVMPDIAYGVAVRGNLVFVAAANKGLQISDIGLSAGLLSSNTILSTHAKYQIAVTAYNSAGASTTATFGIAVNNPPFLINEIPPQSANIGQLTSILLPTIFKDIDGDSLSFTSTLSNGQPLPQWLLFSQNPYSQIYTAFPKTADKKTYNISVTADDGYFGEATAYFLLIVPNQAPVVINSIPTQEASVWRNFDFFASSTTFYDPDGDTLFYRATQKGGSALPSWLSFDNTTRHFSGTPGVTNTQDLNLELFASDGIAETSTDVRIQINISTIFQDLATYYSVSGGALVFFSLIARLLRWRKMQQMKSELVQMENKSREDEKSNVTKESLEQQFEEILKAIELRNTTKVDQSITAFITNMQTYIKNHTATMLSIGDPWVVIEKICNEILSRNLRKMNYQDTLIWAKNLHSLLKAIVESESESGHQVIKTLKETLLATISKANKYIDFKKDQGVALTHVLELCTEAIVSMDDTDSIMDSLHGRDFDIFIDVIKTMIAPPYGAVRLIYQIGNIPGGWYPTLIRLCNLAELAITKEASLTALQKELSSQTNWNVIYEGVGLLGNVARQTQDEQLRQQAVEGGSDKTTAAGIRYYQGFNSFWVQRCKGPGCKDHSGWIRSRADTEAEAISLEHADIEKSPKSPITIEMSPNPLTNTNERDDDTPQP